MTACGPRTLTGIGAGVMQRQPFMRYPLPDCRRSPNMARTRRGKSRRNCRKRIQAHRSTLQAARIVRTRRPSNRRQARGIAALQAKYLRALWFPSLLVRRRRRVVVGMVAALVSPL